MTDNCYIAEFEELVLLAIQKLGENAYGAAIHEALEEAGRVASIGALYTTLGRLEGKGLITSWFGEPTALRGGRAKKFFQVESMGREALSKVAATRRKLVAAKPVFAEV